MRTQKNVMAAMRDGTRLACDLYLPDGEGPVPAILLRTPYLKDQIPADDLYANYEELTAAGYAVVNQDCRGTGHSEGFLDATGAMEADDGYDTIEWIARQKWCNGQVGMHGLSYFGFNQMAAAENNPPHLVAFCPFQNGALLPFSLSRAHTYDSYHLMWIVDRALENLETWVQDEKRREEIQKQLEAFKGNFAAYNAHLPAVDCDLLRISELPQLGAYRLLIDGAEDPAFMKRAHRPICVEGIDRPMFFLTGWFDGALDGTMDNWKAATEGGKRTHDRRLIIGPWLHGGRLGTQIDSYDFGTENTGEAIGIHRMEIEWFDTWMKHSGTAEEKMPVVRYFMLGTNEWHTADTWPPKGTKETAFMLIPSGTGKEGKLSTEPSEEETSVTFTADPMNLPPSMFRDADGNMMLADPQTLGDRGDVLFFRSEVLEKDLPVAGQVKVRLTASISTPDADFFVRLSDLSPQGKALPLAKGIVRCRYRSGDRAEWMTPGEKTELEVDLGHIANCFRKGHRILLDISGGSHPAHDRNLHTKERIGFGTAYTLSEQKVYAASKLILPVLESVDPS